MYRKKKWVYIVCFIVLFIYILALLIPTLMSIVYAAPKTEEIKKLEQELDKASKASDKAVSDYKNNQNKKNYTATDLTQAKNELVQAENEYNRVNEQVNLAQAELDQKKEEITGLEAEVAQHKVAFKQRARLMYERGNATYLEILFGSKNFSDFLQRIEMAKQISEYDAKVLTNLSDAQQELANAKEIIESRLNELTITIKSLSARKAQVESRRASLESAYKKIQDDESELKKAMDAADDAEEKAGRELRAAIKKAEEEEARRKKAEEEARKKNNSGTPSATAAPNYSGGPFTWPAPASRVITSEYGNRFHPIQKKNKFHAGIDIGAAYGTNVVAAESGTVFLVGNGGGYGKYVVIDHGNNTKTLYAHCSSISVSQGQKVTKGQKVGAVGSTGNSTGPHLHFEVIVNGNTVDPRKYI